MIEFVSVIPPIPGTPIQNSVKDLWMLLAFLRLKPFDAREWWNRVIQRPVTQGDRDGLQWVDFIRERLQLLDSGRV